MESPFFILFVTCIPPSFSYADIGIGRIYKCSGDSRLSLHGYNTIISRCRPEGTRCGAGLFFIKDTFVKT